MVVPDNNKTSFLGNTDPNTALVNNTARRTQPTDLGLKFFNYPLNNYIHLSLNGVNSTYMVMDVVEQVYFWAGRLWLRVYTDQRDFVYVQTLDSHLYCSENILICVLLKRQTVNVSILCIT